MADFSEIVDDVLVEAGKTTGPGPAKTLVEHVLKDVMDEVNDRMGSIVFKSRKTVTVAASANLVEMPEDCTKIIEIGEYDSTNQRIKFIWDEISEQEYHERYEGTAVVGPTSEEGRLYVVQDFNGDKGEMRIRPVPAPTSGLTVLVIFYGKLTQETMDRVSGNLLKNGLKAHLSKWFERTFQAHNSAYYRAMDDLKRKHGTVNSPIRRRQSAYVRRANRMGARLV